MTFKQIGLQTGSPDATDVLINFRIDSSLCLVDGNEPLRLVYI